MAILPRQPSPSATASMEPALSSVLGQWRLDTHIQANRDRHHTSLSGIDCWRPVANLGSGSFGDVWQERCVSGRSADAVRAVKSISKRQVGFDKMSRRELEALITFSDTQVPEVRLGEIYSQG